MASDKTSRLGAAGRLGWAAAALIVIVAMCVYRVRVHPDTTLRGILSDPSAFDGREVDLVSEGVVASVSAQGFVLSELGREIAVRAPVDPEDVGRYVHVRGTFHAERPGAPAWIEPAALHVHKGRRWKIWLSLAPLVWVAWLLASSFRLDRARLALELRGGA
jgi:hypothetical protein